MKIEKLTENKIRILLKNEDIKDKNIDLHTIMTKALEDQSFFLDILVQAERELGFTTDGYQLLVEAYSSPDNDFVFTITKYLEKQKNGSNVPKPIVRKASCYKHSSIAVALNSFEDFCKLCNQINHSNCMPKHFAKSIVLYKCEQSYYLIVKDFNINLINYKSIFSILSEFGKIIQTSPHFESKLSEYGEIMIKHNALTTGIKYFV